tara:strand:- start:546 stop:1106 length:561 start_codon:yes stop_codon:yes gene_type:complete
MTSLKKLIDTEIKIKSIDKDGNVVNETTEHNEIINEGVSVIARLLVDPSGARPSHLYARFSGNQTNAQGTSNLGTNNSLVNVLDFLPIDNASGCLREPIFSTAKVEANGSIIDGKITFFFRITEESELTGSFNASASKIYYLGLAAARDLSDYNQDMMISLLEPTTPIEIPTGGQVAIDYTLTLGA